MQTSPKETQGSSKWWLRSSKSSNNCLTIMSMSGLFPIVAMAITRITICKWWCRGREAASSTRLVSSRIGRLPAQLICSIKPQFLIIWTIVIWLDRCLILLVIWGRLLWLSRTYWYNHRFHKGWLKKIKSVSSKCSNLKSFLSLANFFWPKKSIKMLLKCSQNL